MASINNLSLPAIVVVFSTCSPDCSPSFWRLFESSPPEVSRLGRYPNLQSKLRVRAIRDKSSGFEIHGNRVERRPRNRADGVATPSRGPAVFAG